MGIDAASCPTRTSSITRTPTCAGRAGPIPFLARRDGRSDRLRPGRAARARRRRRVAARRPLASASDEVYGQGGLLVRYLIRTPGHRRVPAILRTVARAPGSERCSARTRGFWGMPLEGVWADPGRHGTERGGEADLKICPCSLPPLGARRPCPPTIAPARLTGRCPGDRWRARSRSRRRPVRSAEHHQALRRRPCRRSCGKGVLARLGSTRRVVRPGVARGAAIGAIRIGKLRRRAARPAPARFRVQHRFT